MTIMIQNEIYKIIITPERGGKIESIIYKPDCQELLWHNQQINPKSKLKETDVFDEIWNGGWDEIFPNDAPEKIYNRRYIDHGELWYQPWQVLQKNEDIVRLKVKTDKTQAEIFKEIKFTDKSIYIQHQINNISDKSFTYTWKSHPAFDLKYIKQVQLPAKEVYLSSEFNTRTAKDNMYNWPYLKTVKGKIVDMRDVFSRKSGEIFFQFAKINEGWFKLVYGENVDFDILTVNFDYDFFPYLTLFLVYGGWKNYYTAVLEPSTSYPEKLSETVKNNTYKQLMPLEKVRFGIKLTVK